MNGLSKFYVFLKVNIKIIFCSAYIFLLSLLLMLFCFEKTTGIVFKKTELYENRAMASVDNINNISLLDLPEALEKYLKDNLPLRTQIIYKYRKILKSLGGEDKNVTRIYGKNDQLYYLPELLRKSGKSKLPKHSLDLLKVHIAGKAQYFAEHSIPYIFVLNPDKTTFYPENIPEWAYGDGEWYFDILDTLSNVNIGNYQLIDMYKVLKNSCIGNTTLYYDREYDVVHWNGNALDVAYRRLSIILKNYSWYTVPSSQKNYFIVDKKVNPKYTATNKDVFAPFLALNDPNITLIPNNYFEKYKHTVKYPEKILITNNQAIPNGCIWMITDSYFRNTHLSGSGKKLKPFPLASNVHKMLSTHYHSESLEFYNEMILTHKPNIIIESFVERMFLLVNQIYPCNRAFYVAGEIILSNNRIFITPKDVNEANLIKIDLGVKTKLPRTMPDKNGRLCVLAKIYSSNSGKITLHYKQGNNQFKKPDTVEQEIIEGNNYVYLPIYGINNQEFELALSFDFNGYIKFYEEPSVSEIFEINHK